MFYATVAFDTARTSTDRGAYKAEIFPAYADQGAAAEALTQRGPTFNGVVTYAGVFATRKDAAKAINSYAGRRVAR